MFVAVISSPIADPLPAGPVGPTCVYMTCCTVTITDGILGITGLDCAGRNVS